MKNSLWQHDCRCINLPLPHGRNRLKRALLIAVITILAGCASGTAMKAECEARYSDFPDIVRCTKALIAERRPGLMEDERAKLYVWRGEQLAKAVTEGRISNLDAKVAWQQMLIQGQAENDARMLQILATMPKQTTVNCTSTKAFAGAAINTNCTGTTP